jgi:hypothetical protein
MSRAHAGIPAYARTRLKGLIDVRARYEAMHEGPLRVDSRMTLNPVLSVVIDSMHVDEVHIDGGSAEAGIGSNTENPGKRLIVLGGENSRNGNLCTLAACRTDGGSGTSCFNISGLHIP